MGRKSLYALILRAPLCGANNHPHDDNDVRYNDYGEDDSWYSDFNSLRLVSGGVSSP